MVMNVEGYSDSHRSTFFSASTRSCHASFPTVSEEEEDDERPLRKEKEVKGIF